MTSQRRWEIKILALEDEAVQAVGTQPDHRYKLSSSQFEDEGEPEIHQLLQLRVMTLPWE